MQKQVFNLSEVGIVPSPMGRARVGVDCTSSKQSDSPSLEFLSSLSFAKKFFSLPKRDRRTAFTLAEVLITLGVIGVVSAMTLPTLIKNYQKTVTATRLKATYSTISQAVRMSEVDNGPVATWEIPKDSSSYNTRKAFADTHFKPYLKNIKECTKLSDCIGEKYYSLNGEEIEETNNKPIFVLNNGIVTMVNFQNGKNIQIGIDINGKQGPNTVGKDNFTIVVNAGKTNDTIGKNQPAGSVHFFCQGNTVDFLRNKATYGCNKNAQGSCCGAWIMENGWKIPDEYPW